jgi:hypothetical protein
MDLREIEQDDGSIRVTVDAKPPTADLLGLFSVLTPGAEPCGRTCFLK